MKKYLTALCVITIAASLISCADSENNSKPISDTSIISFRSADIRMAEDFSEILCTEKKSNSFMIFGRLKNGEYSVYHTDNNFTEKKSFIFSPKENETVKTAALLKIGKTAIMTVRGDETIIYTFDSDGNCENEFNCGEVLSPDDYFTELLPADDGFYINMNRQTLAFIGENGEFSGNVDVSGKNICSIVNDSEGIPCALLSRDSKLYLAKLDGNTTAEEIACGEIETYANAVGSGMGEYRITAVFSGGLYGLKETEWIKITDFSDNDFRTHNIFDIEMIAENEFSVMLHHDDGSGEIRLLTERDISEIKQKKIIKLSNTVSSNIDVYNDSIKKFNSENEEFKIEIVDYSGSDDPFDQMKLDIISGNAPDIIKFNTGTFIGGFNSRASIFVDFYSLMDNDKEITRNMFLDGFLEGMESDGKLLQIYPTFSLNTVTIKDKFANGLTKWNYQQFEEAYQNMPQDMIFSQFTVENRRTSIFLDFINCSSFIDYQNAKCSFDSDEFISAMKLIGENKIGLTNAQFDQTDGASMYRDDVIKAYRNDKALVFPWYIGSFREMQEMEQGYMGEPCTFIGYPSSTGNGTYRSVDLGYSIMANSQNIDGAWEFLKYYLFGDDTIFEFSGTGFSGLEKKYTQQLEAAKNYKTIINPETGEEEKEKHLFVLEADENHQVIEIEELTDEQAEEYDKFVRQSLKNAIKSDDTVNTILHEELQYYFEGERSAEETAKIINNRIEIYISENL